VLRIICFEIQEASREIQLSAVVAK